MKILKNILLVGGIAAAGLLMGQNALANMFTPEDLIVNNDVNFATVAQINNGQFSPIPLMPHKQDAKFPWSFVTQKCSNSASCVLDIFAIEAKNRKPLVHAGRVVISVENGVLSAVGDRSNGFNMELSGDNTVTLTQ